MQLSPAAFNAWLNNIGMDFGWRRATACPCINPASGAANPSCPLCHGKKWQWAAEVPARCGFQNQSQSKTFATFGTWEPGDATLTIGSDSPMYGAGQFDRFRCKNATTPFSIIRMKGDTDFLLGTVVSLSRVFWIDADGTTMIEGDLPSIDGDGNLTWSVGQVAPPDDTAYSVTGVKYDEYFSYPDIANDRNMHAGAALPKKLLARKFDLFGR